MCLSSLGYYAGLLISAWNDENAMYADVVAFGAPSECNSSVRYGAQQRNVKLVGEILEDSGYTYDEFREELCNRTTAKFLYNSGMLNVLDDYEQHEAEQQELRDKRRRRNQSRLPGTRLNGYRYAA